MSATIYEANGKYYAVDDATGAVTKLDGPPAEMSAPEPEAAPDAPRDNVITRAVRGALTAFPGPTGQGSLADVTPESDITAPGEAIEGALGMMLEGPARAPGELANAVERYVASGGMGSIPRQPNLVEPTTGRDVAGALLSPQAARLGLEAGASMALTPAGSGLARLGLAGLGAAGGSLLSEPVDPTPRGGGGYGERAAQSAGAGRFSPALGRAGEVSLFAMAGDVAARGFERALRGGTRLMNPTDRASFERVQRAGQTLTPAQVSVNPIVTGLEALPESGLFGSGPIYKARLGAEEAMKNSADDFVNAYIRGASPEEVGELVRDVLVDGRAGWSQTASAMYKKIDDATRGLAAVDLQPTLALADDLVKQYPRAPEVRKLREWVVNEMRNYGEGAVALQSKQGFTQAHALRSDLLGAVGGIPGDKLTVAGQGTVAAKRLAASVDRAMQEAASAVDPAVIPLWRQANAFWKAGAKTWNSAAMKAIARADPENVYRVAFKNATPEGVRRIKSLLDADTAKQMQGYFLMDLMQTARDKNGEVSGALLLRQINKVHGDRKMQAVLGKDWQEWRGIAHALEASQRGSGQYIPGGVRMKIGQATVAVGLASLSNPMTLVAGGLTLGGPKLLGEFFAKPGVARWLTIGARAKPGSEMAVRAFSQLAAAYAEAAYEPEVPLPVVRTK